MKEKAKEIKDGLAYPTDGDQIRQGNVVESISKPADLEKLMVGHIPDEQEGLVISGETLDEMRESQDEEGGSGIEFNVEYATAGGWKLKASLDVDGLSDEMVESFCTAITAVIESLCDTGDEDEEEGQ